MIVVVGAGISGLAAATFLEDDEVRVFEAGAEPGGNVRSDQVDGRVLDRAANGWLDSEPAMGRLLDKVGLTERLVPASDLSSERWVFADGAMQPIPLGPLAMARTRLLRTRDKLRLFAEPFVPRGRAGQTVGEFVQRRLGQAFVDRFVGPMVAGIYAADPYRLSLEAAFPRMHELERDYRSLFLAMLALRRGGNPPGHLQSLPGGAGELTSTLASRLGDRITLSEAVTALEPEGEGWQVTTASGALHADAVVLACPAYAQAELVRPLDAALASELEAIPYAPVAVVITAWPRDAWDRPPRGFGVLTARGERLGGVLGCLFTSDIFPHESRDDEMLLRTIIGGAVHPEAAEGDDEDLLHRARTAHQAWFGPERSEPNMVRIYRHGRGIPQYREGHELAVRTIRSLEARHRGLFLTGNHLLGIGVKDCARSGELVAEGVRRYLAG